MKHKTKNLHIQEEASRRLLDLNSAARYVGVSYWTLRAILHNGEIPFIRIGRRLLVDRCDLDDWIDRNKRREEAY